MDRTGRVLLFDFDGTISLGDGPVIRYAECVADSLPEDQRPLFLAGVAAQSTSRSGTAAGSPIDGYDAVRRTATRFSIADDALGRAYRDSRRDLAGPRAPIEAVPGLAEFLREMRVQALLVLATNSPETRIPEALQALGLDDTFDDVITSVGKPAGLDSVLEKLRAGAPARSLRLLSIGDVWVNDLEPAHLGGFQSALIGSQAPLDATPTFRAERLDELFPVIAAWLSAPTLRVDPAPVSALRRSGVL